ncbi:PREDICTED: circumsporozoite protein-like, partial [Chinchilla lanigera]|uniref:circumsporozoite protein-like n=1 Tax=Chinchilla lanigera TaxID=34839 RepID=UPI00069905FB
MPCPLGADSGLFQEQQLTPLRARGGEHNPGRGRRAALPCADEGGGLPPRRLPAAAAPGRHPRTGAGRTRDPAGPGRFSPGTPQLSAPALGSSAGGAAAAGGGGPGWR